MPLQAVEPQRLYRQIAGQLRTLITAGEWLVGTRLPAERDLARQLGVSRPSVREALIAMEVVALTATHIDALLRVSIILKNQIENNNKEIDKTILL